MHFLYLQTSYLTETQSDYHTKASTAQQSNMFFSTIKNLFTF